MSQPAWASGDEAQLNSPGSWAPLPPDTDDSTESTRVVGWTHPGDFCHIPFTLVGTPCTALVATGSTATLVRPDVVLVETQLEPTTVTLRTSTGELAPMLRKGLVPIQVGGTSSKLEGVGGSDAH